MGPAFNDHHRPVNDSSARDRQDLSRYTPVRKVQNIPGSYCTIRELLIVGLS